MVAGFITGVAFDLFILCAFMFPLFAATFALCASGGIFSSLLTSATMVFALQFSYMAGLTSRGVIKASALKFRVSTSKNLN